VFVDARSGIDRRRLRRAAYICDVGDGRSNCCPTRVGCNALSLHAYAKRLIEIRDIEFEPRGIEPDAVIVRRDARRPRASVGAGGGMSRRRLLFLGEQQVHAESRAVPDPARLRTA
jgi:hypothetical protein